MVYNVRKQEFVSGKSGKAKRSSDAGGSAAEREGQLDLLWKPSQVTAGGGPVRF